MRKTFTCIICPNICEIEIELENNEISKIEGASCKKEKEYANQELSNPQRNIELQLK